MTSSIRYVVTCAMLPEGDLKVFLSHSHVDKRVARRLVRRLTAHGVKVWIDERKLRIGSVLTSSLRDQILAANVVLVIASQASAASVWVKLELEFALQHDKPIVPFFIEPVTEHERFHDQLGVDATSPQAFADAFHGLMRDLFLSIDLEVPPADPALLAAGLRELAQEEPDLAPLIVGCLDSQGLHQENMESLKAAFHPLDEALNALFDLMPNHLMASHAASGFCWAGAGARALALWIAATGDGGLAIVTAVGHRHLANAWIPAAMKLLAACDPPNNHALYQFIHENAEQLDSSQRRAVLRLVTWPLRENTDRDADVLASVALKHFPEAIELQQMWSRWIEHGVFDGKPSAPSNLAWYLADSFKEGLPGWEQVNEALRSHVRGYLRSGDKLKVNIAVDHIQAAADQGAPVLVALLREANGVSGTAEWNDWRSCDPETAAWMGWYVQLVAEEASKERNWLRALNETKAMVEFEKVRQQSLGNATENERESTEPDTNSGV